MNILTPRLILWPMTAAFLKASLAHDVGETETEMQESGGQLDLEWFDERPVMEMRLADLQADPEAREWLLRAMIDRQTKQMVGYLGFHTRPDPAYLQPHCPGGVEFGYTVFSRYRRRGYALEAASALMEWARRTHGQTKFVLSVSPQNEPSLGPVYKLGFERIGEHIDEIDGLEWIFRRDVNG